MATYPDSPVPSQGYEWSDEFQTWVAGPYPSGRMVTAPARQYELFAVKLRYNREVRSSLTSVYDLFKASKGRHGTFTFKDFSGIDSSPVGAPWKRLYVGVGTGAATTFDLPICSSSSRTLRVAGVAKTEGVDWTFGSGTGADGRDRAVFGSAPAAGAILDLDATGRRTVTASFAVDAMPWREFVRLLVETGLSIVERR